MTWRRIGLLLFLGALGVLGVLDLTAIARRGGPTWSVGDGAMIELYTIHAMHGVQLLGAYSQYGWQHPGPMFFYLLAPFYVLGGQTMFGLNAGALVFNLASVATLALIVSRREDRSTILMVILAGLLFAYLLRLPGLLTSAWNPHPPVLALLALMAVCAACLCGRVRLLPLAAFLASFITQTHVGFVPVAAALAAMTVAGLLVAAVRRPEIRLPLGRWGLLSVGILEAVWLAPVSEQLLGHPGNLTRIWRFFFSGGPPQTLGGAWRAWGSMLTGVLQNDFTLALGGGFSGATNLWPPMVATFVVFALVPVTFWGWRTSRHLHGALAGLALVTSVVSFWSTARIVGAIGDYQVFWLSALGVLNMALVLSAVVTPAAERFMGEPWRIGLGRAAAAALVVATCAAGRAELVAGTRPFGGSPEAAVQSLTEQVLRTLPSMGGRRTLIRLGAIGAGVSPGFLVAMSKTSMPFAIDAAAAPLYGPSLATTGGEDTLLTLCDPALHRELVKRRQNVTLAMFDGGLFGDAPLFVDAVSLVDAPEYRNAP